MTFELRKIPEESFVYVGNKGLSAYVLAGITKFGSGSDEIVIAGKGNHLNKVVETALALEMCEASIGCRLQKEFHAEYIHEKSRSGGAIKVPALYIQISKGGSLG